MRMTIIALSAVSMLAACDAVQINSSVLKGGSGGSGGSGAFKTRPQPQAAPQETRQAGGADSSAPAFDSSAATVASLGDPSVPGMWMETPLVTSEQQARVRSARGSEAVVTLKPAVGAATAGSRLSIEAMRALGLPLTELANVQVLPAG
ncbi:hypothetical protein [Cribrihabitans pelagius]|uniref:hypothetical protein n=1 Tax=Cribrihabitans pelagius TaxID=1765746 RepID=UPI003B5B0EC9